MANKNILIKIEVNDKASPQIKNTGNAVDKLAKSVDLLSKSEQKEFVIAEQSRIKKTAQIQGLKQQAAAALQVEAATNGVRATSGLNNAILLETGRLASDASYGFQGIANNLGQLISLFQISAKNSGGFVAALKQVGGQILGTGGVLIAIQLMISFLPQLERWFNKTSHAAEEAAKEMKELTQAISEQIEMFERLTYKHLPDFILTGKALDETVKLLSNRFSKFKAGVENLKEKGLDKSEESLTKLLNNFNRLNVLQKELIITNKKYTESLAGGSEVDGKRTIALRKKHRDILAEMIMLEEDFKVKRIERIDETSQEKIIFDMEKQKHLLIDINELELERGIVRDIDPEMEKDNFLLQFKIKNIQEEIEAKRKASLQELDIYYKDLDNFTFIESEKAKINAFYNKEQADAAIKSGKDFDDLQQKKLAALATFTEGFSQLLGEQSAAGKAFASATALIDTYAAVMQVWSDKSLPYAFKVIASAGVLATGISNVQKINAVDVSGRGQAGAAGGTINAPDFNVVGTSETSQLAQAVGQTSQSQVVKAYVVSSEITSQQQFDRDSKNLASL